MATIPYFVFSPSTILSLSGILRGPDPIKATPAEDWRDARIDVVIPALNEAENIVLCLASVLHQTVRPRRIFLIDDGSTDDTVERAKSFCRQQGVELTAIQRGKPIGKTPTLKRQARELDSDVEFVLDADTVLESTNYIERTVQELYQAVGIASAFGTILPQRKKDRRDAEHMPGVRRFLRTRSARSTNESARPAGWIHDAARGVTNVYREVLYLFLQRIIYRGQIGLFGTTSNPVGCAVAYRRKYVHALFEHISPILGDDSDEFRRHLHRLLDAERGLSERSAERRLRTDGRARGAPVAAPDVSVVVRLSAVVLLLRSAAAKSAQGVQPVGQSQAPWTDGPLGYFTQTADSGPVAWGRSNASARDHRAECVARGASLAIIITVASNGKCDGRTLDVAGGRMG